MGPYTGGNNYEIATGSVEALSLTVTTGAATFGNTVRINGEGQSLLIFPTTTNSVRMQIQSTGGGNLVVGTESSTGGNLATGTNAYASVFTSGSTKDLVLGTNSIARLTINGSSGNVGIGTNNPGGILDVSGNDAASLSALRLRNTSTTSGGLTNLSFYSYVSAFGGVTGNAAEICLLATNFSNTGSGSLLFKTTSSITTVAPVERMRITDGGTVQVGGWGTGADVCLRINGNSNGQVAFFNHNGQLYIPFLDAGVGTTLVLTSGGFINKLSSSRRYKKDIEPIDIGLDFIMSLNPIKFNVKSDGLAQVGFVAEEFPDERLVSFSQVDIKDASKGLQRESINYAQIVAPLVKAIQELKAELDELKSKN